MKHKIILITLLVLNIGLLVLAGFGVAHLLEKEAECVQVVSALGYPDCIMIEQ